MVNEKCCVDVNGVFGGLWYLCVDLICFEAKADMIGCLCDVESRLL